ncbi:hypothetical protein LTR36_007044 [Oleoguttula mirabilis]|uniref:Uncharacterized protein n=1 Tax=Oleoguttula mirabilis TaxID=1507867 RepID=A0AAV9JAN4_9PEZI|nr:hypothetical protein LTR36_007044 [Oleoguttula mirabilis]
MPLLTTVWMVLLGRHYRKEDPPLPTDPKSPITDNLNRLLTQAEGHTRDTSLKYQEAVLIADAAGDDCRALLEAIKTMHRDARETRSTGVADALRRSIEIGERQMEQAQTDRGCKLVRAWELRYQRDQAVDDETMAREKLREHLAGRESKSDEREEDPAQGEGQSAKAEQSQGDSHQQQSRRTEGAQQKPMPKRATGERERRRAQAEKAYWARQREEQRQWRQARGGYRDDDDPYAKIKQREPIAQANIDAFFAASKLAFADYAVMRCFPEPELTARCASLACRREEDTRTLLTCPCAIKTVFGGLDKSQLKAIRLQYHPDKFARCEESIRAGFQAKA